MKKCNNNGFLGSSAARAGAQPLRVTPPPRCHYSKRRKPSRSSPHSPSGVKQIAKRQLPPPGPEQIVAIKALSEKNLILESAAGCGKTTTTLLLAAHHPELQFLLLVYNRRLMEQTAERIEELELTNISVYNYHTLGHRFYTHECAIDEGLKRVVSEDLSVAAKKGLPKFDVLVLDEQQDMTPVLYAFVTKLIRDSFAAGPHEDETAKRSRFVLLGDPRQELYGYNGADSRFLTLAPRLFGRYAEGGGGGNSWLSIRLDTSYRLTPATVDFINEQVLKPPPGEEMVAAPAAASGEKPLYLVSDAYDTDIQKDPLRLAKHLLVDRGYSPESILFLAPSVRSLKTPMRNLANRLCLDHPVFISDSFDTTASQRAKRGKLIFSTYHQSKGTEARIVFLSNFDDSFNKFFDKNPSTTERASNAQYVACTRAIERLVLVHHYRYNYLSFIDLDTLEKTCRREGLGVCPQNEEATANMDNKPIKFSVTGLVKDLAASPVAECINELSLERVPITPSCRLVHPKTEIDLDNGLVEDVYDITGTAIPAIYELRSRKSCLTFGEILRGFEKRSKGGLELLSAAGLESTARLKYDSRLREICDREKERAMTIADILFLANIKRMKDSGYINKVLSIPLDAYTWVTEAQATQIYLNLRHLIPRTKIAYEAKLGGLYHSPATTLGPVAVFGCTDVRTSASNPTGTVWELKAGSLISPEHLLQTAIYSAILERLHKREYPAYLVNALNGRSIRIKPKSEQSYERIVQTILAARLSKNVDSRDSGETFLQMAEGNFEDSCHPALPRWVTEWMMPR